ncbi:hypothetical protein F5Y13DRAFT_192589 [Hypoxylon sp. FL1857]|nr:hypothetical protein F5Y13DRAFT_192589 [Hypoxylon sp. FL1857]
MSAIASALARGGRRRGLSLSVVPSALQACQRRSTSWIAWEQPDPSLYAPPPGAALSNEAQQAASVMQGARNIGETSTAPANSAIAGGSLEVFTSGKTVSSSIQAGTSLLPLSQTRRNHSKSKVENSPYLPTTLIRIPGEAATWPVEIPECPDQPRIRRIHTAHENEGPIRKEETSTLIPKAKDTTERHILQTFANLTIGLEALEQNPILSHPIVSFEKAVKNYMNGVQTREEALARAKELEAARQVVDEKDRDEWRGVIKEALDTSIDKADSEGKCEGEVEGGKKASTG